MESAKKLLRTQIRAYEEGADVDSPVSVTLDLKSLRLDNSIAERLLKEMYDLKNQLKETESNIESTIMLWSG